MDIDKFFLAEDIKQIKNVDIEQSVKLEGIYTSNLLWDIKASLSL